jgi:signal transduction histidine kinase
MVENAQHADPPSRLAGALSPSALTAINVAVTVACLAIAALASDAGDWRPLDLLLIVAVFTTVAEFGAVWFPREIAGSLASVGLAVAMTFLGPLPAVVIGVLAVGIESLYRRIPAVRLLANVANYALWTTAGSLAIGAALGGYPPRADAGTLLFAVIVLAFANDMASFAYVCILHAISMGRSVRRSVRSTLLPLLAYHVVTAAFTGAAAVVYVAAGAGALAAVLALLLLASRLMRAVALAQEREQQVAELAMGRARLLAEALTTEERERVRLAGEIHDDALQELAVAQLELRDAGADPAALERARRSVDAGVAAIRSTLSRIVPAVELRSTALHDALAALAADLCEPAGLAWEVAVAPAADTHDRTLVCSLARELVTNVVKHAGASRVGIRVEAAGEGVRLEVSDDGRGFGSHGTPPRAGHLGLALV